MSVNPSSANAEYELSYEPESGPYTSRRTELRSKITNEKRVMTKNFECVGFPGYQSHNIVQDVGGTFERYAHGKKASAENGHEATILKVSVCWQYWDRQDEYEDEEHFLCSKCADMWKEEDNSRRSFNKRKANARKDKKVKRIAATIEGSEEAFEVNSKLLKLKANHLKQLCVANDLMVSGNKDVLADRISNAHLHGRPDKPPCGHSKLELVFTDESPTEPVMVSCRHMRGQGSRCPWGKQITPQTKATVLPLKLVDSADGNLESIGISVEK